MPVRATDAPVHHAPPRRDRCASARDADDRCPGVLRPHRAQDGLLVRVRLIGGRVDAPGLRAIAAAARRGNGIVELTSRANVQVRGLTADDVDALAAAFTTTGLLRSATHERIRNVVADPLAGRRPGAVAAPAEIDALLNALDDALCADPRSADLSGRYLHVVDDGSGAIDAVDADVRLRAIGAGRWTVDAGPLGVTTTDLPVGAALAVAHRFLDVRPEGVWRIGELEAARPRPGTTVDAPLLGVLAQPDGRVACGGLAPLGRLAPETIELLAAEADAGAGVRVSHRRTVALVDVTADRAAGVLAALAASGLVVEPGSGWEGLTACAGRGACAKALGDVRAGAAARAAERGPGAPREHWSGCERRCGQTSGVERAVVARADGTWEVA